MSIFKTLIAIIYSISVLFSSVETPVNTLLNTSLETKEVLSSEVSIGTFELINEAEVKSDKYIVGLKPRLTKIAFANTYVSTENVTIEYKLANSTRYMGTGSVITFIDDITGEILAEYTVIIYGDVNGNGQIDSVDANYVQSALSGNSEALTEIERLAANIVGSRTIINDQDVASLQDVAFGQVALDQKTGKIIEENSEDNVTDTIKNLSGKKIVFLGDSIFEQAEIEGYNWNSIPNIVKEITKADTYNFAISRSTATSYNSIGSFTTMNNRWSNLCGEGISEAIATGNYENMKESLHGIMTTYADDSSWDYTRWFDKDDKFLMEGFDFSNVDYFVVNWGTNDWNVARSYENWTTPYTTPDNNDSWSNSMRKIIFNLRQAAPNVKIVICSVLPRFANVDNARIIPEGVEEYALAAEKLAKEQNAYFIDLYNIGIANKTNLTNQENKGYLHDGLHPSIAGCQLIANTISAKLFNFEQLSYNIFAKNAYATIVTASDFQQDKLNEFNSFENMVMLAKNDGLPRPNNVFLGGDYNNSTGANPDISISKIKTIFNNHYNIADEQFLFVQGNHDLVSNQLSVDGLYDKGDYFIYLLNEDSFPSGRTSENARLLVQESAAKLRESLQLIIHNNKFKPVFVLSHVPLHHNSRTNYTDNIYSKYIFDVLNEYGSKLDIIFLFGHNHSSNYDNYIGGSVNFLATGDTIRIPNGTPNDRNAYTNETLTFTYTNYGYVGSISNSTKDGSTSIKTIGIFQLCPNEIRFIRYCEAGYYNTKIIAKHNTII